MRKAINWRYALGELSLIVFGILIALGIDSYVREAESQRQARVYLQDLSRELSDDAIYLEGRKAQLEKMIASARTVLDALEPGDTGDVNLGTALLRSLGGDGTTRESVIWVELTATGNLRLIEDSAIRSAVVSHYVNRDIRFESIETNFMPAVRALRALAWEVIPIDDFPRYFRTGDPEIGNEELLDNLRQRDDAVYLLKRLILTGSVALINLENVRESSLELVDSLSEYS